MAWSSSLGSSRTHILPLGSRLKRNSGSNLIWRNSLWSNFFTVRWCHCCKDYSKKLLAFIATPNFGQKWDRVHNQSVNFYEFHQDTGIGFGDLHRRFLLILSIVSSRTFHKQNLVEIFSRVRQRRCFFTSRMVNHLVTCTWVALKWDDSKRACHANLENTMGNVCTIYKIYSCKCIKSAGTVKRTQKVLRYIIKP